MKKIFCSLIVLLSSIFTIQPVSADVVMGMHGPQVVASMAPPPNFGPIVGGGVINSNPSMGSVPMAVVDQNGNVGNVILCDPISCSSGAFANSPDIYVPQITPDNRSIWGGVGTTHYDKNNGEFTIVIPGLTKEEEVVNSDGSITKIVILDSVQKTVYKNFTDKYGSVSSTAITQQFQNQEKTIIAEKNILVETLIIQKPENVSETELIIRNSELTLIIDNINKVLEMINGWK